ncbi:MAG: methyl-accepting chemotaxis protein [Oscillospiraceae bacterium]|nr:methyl-accepting chemotaxis protein [Oscillospiraceae bacterium]
MRKLVLSDETNCTGCNRCMRACPVDGANIGYEDDGKIKVRIDDQKCIVCGSCIAACKHDCRDFEDDTERFLGDLKNGVKISLFAAPANRTQGGDVDSAIGGRIITWLKSLGVNKIYDVSLGADICTWGHIRYIQKYKPKTLITQPCPAIVNYILIHKQELMKYLSPVQSPMLCTAIYMKKYCGINDKIAALSPCIAKTHEFESAGYVHYNVTMKRLYDYVEQNGITLPNEDTPFDHPDSELGRLYSMPGGLKETVEFYLGKTFRIDQSEGADIVYNDLAEFAKQREDNLPVVFDVLNCREGCNIGTGCRHRNRNRFEAAATMERQRREVIESRGKEGTEKAYAEYDKKLRLEDFTRRYTPITTKSLIISEAQIEKAYIMLGKDDEEKRRIDCSACGCDTCYEMAREIALGLNIPQNCVYKSRLDILKSHEMLFNIQKDSLKDIKLLLNDMTEIKGRSDDIVDLIVSVTDAIDEYTKMSRDIDFISSNINIIAVNASIEAARAGIHGKSFAIIADEVRMLAGKSQKTVAQTSEISENASKSVSSINGKISTISEEIAQAYDEITRVYDNIKQIVKGEPDNSETDEINKLSNKR